MDGFINIKLYKKTEKLAVGSTLRRNLQKYLLQLVLLLDMKKYTPVYGLRSNKHSFIRKSACSYLLQLKYRFRKTGQQKQ